MKRHVNTSIEAWPSRFSTWRAPRAGHPPQPRHSPRRDSTPPRSHPPRPSVPPTPNATKTHRLKTHPHSGLTPASPALNRRRRADPHPRLHPQTNSAPWRPYQPPVHSGTHPEDPHLRAWAVTGRITRRWCSGRRRRRARRFSSPRFFHRRSSRRAPPRGYPGSDRSTPTRTARSQPVRGEVEGPPAMG